ncbi:MAG: endonuclease/exonuclease/phosphatase family protein [Nocardioides sp.]
MRPSNTRRDPTVLLVLALVVVLAALVATPLLMSSPDTSGLAERSEAQIFATPSAVEPSPLPSVPAPTKRVKPMRDRAPKLDIKKQGQQQCVPADEDVDFTVVSYNIKSGHVAGSLARISEVLRASGADVVLLQEVDQLRYASGRIDMPAVLGAQLDLRYAFGKNVPHADGGGYGTMILSRFPFVSVENTFLPQPAGTQRRGLLHTVLDVDGVEVSVYNTHLQNADPAARLLQAAAIDSLVADDPRPRILGGDMNAPPGSPPMNVLTRLWTDTWTAVGTGSGRTAPAGAPRARIDYLLHGGSGLAPLATDVLPVRLSDHLAVRASYRLAGVGAEICFQKLS